MEVNTDVKRKYREKRRTRNDEMSGNIKPTKTPDK